MCTNAHTRARMCIVCAERCVVCGVRCLCACAGRNVHERAPHAQVLLISRAFPSDMPLHGACRLTHTRIYVECAARRVWYALLMRVRACAGRNVHETEPHAVLLISRLFPSRMPPRSARNRSHTHIRSVSVAPCVACAVYALARGAVCANMYVCGAQAATSTTYCAARERAKQETEGACVYRILAARAFSHVLCWTCSAVARARARTHTHTHTRSTHTPHAQRHTHI